MIENIKAHWPGIDVAKRGSQLIFDGKLLLNPLFCEDIMAEVEWLLENGHVRKPTVCVVRPGR
jgi:hypothetical protein